ncbi:hypothetical protein Anas_13454 [Armadillidium nasatum]|uniref:Uncharacterized protein n=1 Tax=Armadillidium nasatum TaxID=96803 RepID=A0A5N5T972_9CRUS|nr:hypothetical protein Anas_13454 [Armadillidium nasatum]
MLLTCFKIYLAYVHLHFTVKQELFSEIKFSRMVNVLENISQELYHLIIQQKHMSRTVSATVVQGEMDIEKAQL